MDDGTKEMSHESTKSNLTRKWTPQDFEVFNDVLEEAALTCEHIMVGRRGRRDRVTEMTITPEQRAEMDELVRRYESGDWSLVSIGAPLSEIQRWRTMSDERKATITERELSTGIKPEKDRWYAR